MTERINPPRLSIDITEEQDRKLRELIPWGQKRTVIYCLLDELISFLDCIPVAERGIAIGALTARKLSVLDIIRAREEKKVGRRKKQNGLKEIS